MARTFKAAQFFPPGIIPLQVLRMARQGDILPHQHEFSELVIITGGQGTHATGTEEYPVLAGDVFVIRGSSAHSYRNTQDLSLINIMFDPDQLQIPAWDIRQLPGYHALFMLEPHYRARHKFSSRLRLPIDDLMCVDALASKMESELQARQPGFQYLAVAHFMAITGFLSRCYARARTPSARSLLRLGNVISYLEQNLTQKITIQQLAETAHMSESTLRRAFHETTGYAPIDYLIRLRVARAVKLLRDGNTRISEVAWQAGFEDSNYFTRQFRKITGHSPRAFSKSFHY